jgi:hypothetical protein
MLVPSAAGGREPVRRHGWPAETEFLIQTSAGGPIGVIGPGPTAVADNGSRRYLPVAPAFFKLKDRIRPRCVRPKCLGGSRARLGPRAGAPRRAHGGRWRRGCRVPESSPEALKCGWRRRQTDTISDWNRIYGRRHVRPIWYLIMVVICGMPEFVFKRLRL